jgi:hypothetical protein
MGEKNRRKATVRKAGFARSLLDFCFAVGNVLAGDRIEFFGFELLGFGPLIFGHGVEVTGSGGGNEFDEIAGHGNFS